MHSLKKPPFLTRPGQFSPGKQSLAIGIDRDALKGDGVHEFCFASDPKKIYYKSKKFLMDFHAAHPRDYYESPGGSIAAVFPLDIFETRESPQKSLFER